MATNLSSSAKREWLVIIQDCPDADEKRVALAKAHLEDMRPRRGTFWMLGGALLNEGMLDHGKKKIQGNVLIAQAETRDEVLTALKEDAYANGVWNLETVQVLAYESVFRRGLGIE